MLFEKQGKTGTGVREKDATVEIDKEGSNKKQKVDPQRVDTWSLIKYNKIVD